MHRLDRPTSGLLLVAKSRVVQEAFAAHLASGALERTYHATVHGEVTGESSTIDLPLGRDPHRDYRRAVVPLDQGGQTAVTHWRVVDRHSDRTRLEVRIETGRTHQIRVHLAAMGTPIAGDALYREGAESLPDGGPRPGVTDLALRAVRLTFPHPTSGQRVTVTAADTE